MIIIGWPNCKTCKILKEKYPKLEYIELSKISFNDKTRKIKRILGKYNIDTFPVIMKNDLSEPVHMKDFDLNFAKAHLKLY